MITKKECVAMLLAGGQGSRLFALTQKKAKPAVPYGGKYKIIDFPLSNCANSGIDTVGVLTQYEPLELNSYIGTGGFWDLDNMNGGAFVLPPYVRGEQGNWYRGTADAIYQNINFIDNYDPDHIIVLSGDQICCMDYQKMLNYHKKKGADCTISVLEVTLEEAKRFGIMNTDEDNRIEEFEEKPAHPKSTKASMGIYVFKWKLIRQYLIDDANDPDSEHDFGKNIIPRMLEEGKKTGIHVLSCAAVSKGFEGKERTDMEGLLKAGAAGFTDDGIPLMDGMFVKEAMEEAARLDTVLSFHEEDKTFIKQNGINHGKVSEQLGIYGSPALAEDSLVARDCMIALATGARIDIQHISSGHSVEMVRLAKKMGANVWAEVTPHHFTLTEDAVLEHGTLAKMNPPLRTEWDRQMLIEGLKDGTIDMIATDHAPHSKEEKEKPITEAPSGITGLETSLALGITSLVKPGHLTLMELMEKMSLNPAKLYKLDCGRLEEGAAADLVIFDENEKWVVDGFASKAINSPFLGTELTGRVKYTICDGKVVYRQ